MRKLILGIIAVICLDIGFNAYVRSDHPAETITTAGNDEVYQSNSVGRLVDERIETTSRPEVGPAEVITEKRATAHSGDRERIKYNSSRIDGRQKESVQMSLRSDKKDRRRPAGVNNRRQPDHYAQLKPVEIRFKKVNSNTNLSENKSNVPNSAKEDGPRSDSKSFVARALPILKKPYDWLKALGAKMK